jgi:hypothetical protein
MCAAEALRFVTLRLVAAMLGLGLDAGTRERAADRSRHSLSLSLWSRSCRYRLRGGGPLCRKRLFWHNAKRPRKTGAAVGT